MRIRASVLLLILAAAFAQGGFYQEWLSNFYDNFTTDQHVDYSFSQDIYIDNGVHASEVNYSYRQPVYISSKSTLTDFQVAINVTYDAAMNPDFSDLRFTYFNGTDEVEIPYFIEKKVDGAWAYVWIKVPTITSNTTVYMYYGNPNATSESNPNEVFDFYDGFETWSSWVKYGNGVVSQSTDYVRKGDYSLKKDQYADPNGAYKELGFTLDYPFVLEAWIYRSYLSGSNADRIGVIDASGNGYGPQIAHYTSGNDALMIDKRSGYSGTGLGKVYTNARLVNQWYFVRFIWNDGNMEAKYFDADGNLKGSTSATDTSYSSFTRVYVFGGYTYYVDELRIRKYGPTPTVSFGGQESLKPNPKLVTTLISTPFTITKFANLTVNVSGNVTFYLADANLKTQVELGTTDVPTTFNISSIDPTIFQDGFRIVANFTNATIYEINLTWYETDIEGPIITYTGDLEGYNNITGEAIGSDPSGIDECNVSLDGVEIPSVLSGDTCSFNITGTFTQHNLTICMYDIYGNERCKSYEITLKGLINSDESIRITNPGDYDLNVDYTSLLNVTVNATFDFKQHTFNGSLISKAHTEIRNSLIGGRESNLTLNNVSLNVTNVIKPNPKMLDYGFAVNLSSIGKGSYAVVNVSIPDSRARFWKFNGSWHLVESSRWVDGVLTSGNLTTFSTIVALADVVPPSITFISPTPSNNTFIGAGNVTIKARIADDAYVDSVILRVIKRDAFGNAISSNDYPMDTTGTGTELNATYYLSITGSNYSIEYFVIANDSSGNVGTSVHRYIHVPVYVTPPAELTAPGVYELQAPAYINTSNSSTYVTYNSGETTFKTAVVLGSNTKFSCGNHPIYGFINTSDAVGIGITGENVTIANCYINLTIFDNPASHLLGGIDGGNNVYVDGLTIELNSTADAGLWTTGQNYEIHNLNAVCKKQCSFAINVFTGKIKGNTPYDNTLVNVTGGASLYLEEISGTSIRNSYLSIASKTYVYEVNAQNTTLAIASPPYGGTINGYTTIINRSVIDKVLLGSYNASIAGATISQMEIYGSNITISNSDIENLSIDVSEYWTGAGRTITLKDVNVTEIESYTRDPTSIIGYGILINSSDISGVKVKEITAYNLTLSKGSYNQSLVPYHDLNRTLEISKASNTTKGILSNLVYEVTQDELSLYNSSPAYLHFIKFNETGYYELPTDFIETPSKGAGYYDVFLAEPLTEFSNVSLSAESDDDPPNVIINFPTSGYYTSNITLIKVNVTDLSGVDHVIAEIDPLSPNAYNVTLAFDGTYWYNDTINIGEGEHTIRIYAYDVYGNVNNTEYVKIIVLPVTLECDGSGLYVKYGVLPENPMAGNKVMLYGKVCNNSSPIPDADVWFFFDEQPVDPITVANWTFENASRDDPTTARDEWTKTGDFVSNHYPDWGSSHEFDWYFGLGHLSKYSLKMYNSFADPHGRLYRDMNYGADAIVVDVKYSSRAPELGYSDRISIVVTLSNGEKYHFILHTYGMGIPSNTSTDYYFDYRNDSYLNVWRTVLIPLFEIQKSLHDELYNITRISFEIETSGGDSSHGASIYVDNIYLYNYNKVKTSLDGSFAKVTTAPKYVGNYTSYVHVDIGYVVGKDTWAKTFGGSGSDEAFSVQQTSDGGFIITGYTDSYGAGNNDILLIKLDSDGGLKWAKTYGRVGSEQACSIQQTSDGYAIAGSFPSEIGYIFVLKLDTSGNIQWIKSYGGYGSLIEGSSAFQQTSDGGYILAGTAKTTVYPDFLILKLDSEGNLEWAKSYGGPDSDWAYSIQQTSDGGYIVAGETPSFGAGSYDILILKLDSEGNLEWAKSYGTAGYEVAYSIQQTSDDGYVVAGTSGYNPLVLKLDSNGNLEWAKVYEGTRGGLLYSIQRTSDGGYIAAGREIQSSGIPTYDDILILKLDSDGDLVWARTFVGTYNDMGRSIQQTSDGGYIVAGSTNSYGAGGYDALILKLNTSGDVSGCDYIQDNPRTTTSLTIIQQDVSPSSTTPSLAYYSPTLSSGFVNLQISELYTHRRILLYNETEVEVGRSFNVTINVDKNNIQPGTDVTVSGQGIYANGETLSSGLPVRIFIDGVPVAETWYEIAHFDFESGTQGWDYFGNSPGYETTLLWLEEAGNHYLSVKTNNTGGWRTMTGLSFYLPPHPGYIDRIKFKYMPMSDGEKSYMTITPQIDDRGVEKNLHLILHSKNIDMNTDLRNNTENLYMEVSNVPLNQWTEFIINPYVYGEKFISGREIFRILFTQRESSYGELLQFGIDDVSFLQSLTTRTQTNGVYSYTLDTSALTPGGHRVSVSVVDEQGIVGTNQTYLQVLPVIITILSPENGSCYRGDVELRVTSNSEMVEWGYQLDGVWYELTPNVDTGVYAKNFTVTLTGLSSGMHTLKVNGTTLSGAYNETDTIIFYVDTKPPVVTLLYPPNNSAVHTKLNFTVIDDASPVMDCTVYYETANRKFQTTLEVENSTIASVDIPSIPGIWYWSVSCTDKAGNIGSSDEWTFKIEGEIPGVFVNNTTGSFEIHETGYVDYVNQDVYNITVDLYHEGTWLKGWKYRMPIFFPSSGYSPWPMYEKDSRSGFMAAVPYIEELYNINCRGGAVAGDGVVVCVDRYSEDVGVMKVIDENTGQELWEFNWRTAYTPVPIYPAIYGDLIVVSWQYDRIIVFNKTTGEIIWEAGGSGENPISGDWDKFVRLPIGESSGVMTPPVVRDGVLYIYVINQSGYAEVFALNVNDGGIIWDTETQAYTDAGVFYPPLVTKDKLFVVVSYEEVAHIYALNRTSGDILWHVDYSGLDTFTPCSVASTTSDGDIVFFVLNAGSPLLVALNGTTGEELWNVSGPFYIGAYGATPKTGPFYADGRVLVMGDLEGCALAAYNATSGKFLWVTPLGYECNDYGFSVYGFEYAKLGDYVLVGASLVDLKDGKILLTYPHPWVHVDEDWALGDEFVADGMLGMIGEGMEGYHDGLKTIHVLGWPHSYGKIIVDTENLIAHGKMRPDCEDIRVVGVYSNATDVELKVLPYYVDNCNSRNTTVYFFAPRYVDGMVRGGIYLYYGNFAASSEELTNPPKDVDIKSAETSERIFEYNGRLYGVIFDGTNNVTNLTTGYPDPVVVLSYPTCNGSGSAIGTGIGDVIYILRKEIRELSDGEFPTYDCRLILDKINATTYELIDSYVIEWDRQSVWEGSEPPICTATLESAAAMRIGATNYVVVSLKNYGYKGRVVMWIEDGAYGAYKVKVQDVPIDDYDFHFLTARYLVRNVPPRALDDGGSSWTKPHCWIYKLALDEAPQYSELTGICGYDYGVGPVYAKLENAEGVNYVTEYTLDGNDPVKRWTVEFSGRADITSFGCMEDVCIFTVQNKPFAKTTFNQYSSFHDTDDIKIVPFVAQKGLTEAVPKYYVLHVVGEDFNTGCEIDEVTGRDLDFLNTCEEKEHFFVKTVEPPQVWYGYRWYPTDPSDVDSTWYEVYNSTGALVEKATWNPEDPRVSITLPEDDTYYVQIYANNSLGNITQVDLRVIKDTTPPNIQINVIRNNSEDYVTVEYHVTDAYLESCAYSINGEYIDEIPCDGIINLTANEVTTDPFTLEIMATDKAKNTATVPVTLKVSCMRLKDDLILQPIYPASPDYHYVICADNYTIEDKGMRGIIIINTTDSYYIDFANSNITGSGTLLSNAMDRIVIGNATLTNISVAVGAAGNLTVINAPGIDPQHPIAKYFGVVTENVIGNISLVNTTIAPPGYVDPNAVITYNGRPFLVVPDAQNSVIESNDEYGGIIVYNANNTTIEVNMSNAAYLAVFPAASDANVTINNSFINNSRIGLIIGDGEVYHDGNATFLVTNTRIVNNQLGILMRGAEAKFTNCVVAGNDKMADGGGTLYGGMWGVDNQTDPSIIGGTTKCGSYWQALNLYDADGDGVFVAPGAEASGWQEVRTILEYYPEYDAGVTLVDECPLTNLTYTATGVSASDWITVGHDLANTYGSPENGAQEYRELFEKESVVPPVIADGKLFTVEKELVTSGKYQWELYYLVASSANTGNEIWRVFLGEFPKEEQQPITKLQYYGGIICVFEAEEGKEGAPKASCFNATNGAFVSHSPVDGLLVNNYLLGVNIGYGYIEDTWTAIVNVTVTDIAGEWRTVGYYETSMEDCQEGIKDFVYDEDKDVVYYLVSCGRYGTVIGYINLTSMDGDSTVLNVTISDLPYAQPVLHLYDGLVYFAAKNESSYEIYAFNTTYFGTVLSPIAGSISQLWKQGNLLHFVNSTYSEVGGLNSTHMTYNLSSHELQVVESYSGMLYYTMNADMSVKLERKLEYSWEETQDLCGNTVWYWKMTHHIGDIDVHYSKPGDYMGIPHAFVWQNKTYVWVYDPSSNTPYVVVYGERTIVPHIRVWINDELTDKFTQVGPVYKLTVGVTDEFGTPVSDYPVMIKEVYGSSLIVTPSGEMGSEIATTTEASGNVSVLVIPTKYGEMIGHKILVSAPNAESKILRVLVSSSIPSTAPGWWDKISSLVENYNNLSDALTSVRMAYTYYITVWGPNHFYVYNIQVNSDGSIVISDDTIYLKGAVLILNITNPYGYNITIESTGGDLFTGKQYSFRTYSISTDPHVAVAFVPTPIVGNYEIRIKTYEGGELKSEKILSGEEKYPPHFYSIGDLSQNEKEAVNKLSGALSNVGRIALYLLKVWT